MNTLVATLVKHPKAAGSAVLVIPVAAGGAALDAHLPSLVIPLAPAGIGAGLLVTLGWFLRRARETSPGRPQLRERRGAVRVVEASRVAQVTRIIPPAAVELERGGK